MALRVPVAASRGAMSRSKDVRHGTFDMRTLWCEAPAIGMLRTTTVADVTCRRCRTAYATYLGEVAKQVKLGRPITTGRGSPGAKQLKLTFSAAEWAEITKAGLDVDASRLARESLLRVARRRATP